MKTRIKDLSALFSFTFGKLRIQVYRKGYVCGVVTINSFNCDRIGLNTKSDWRLLNFRDATIEFLFYDNYCQKHYGRSAILGCIIVK